MTRVALLTLALAVGNVLPAALAQSVPKHEFRGAWIATVVNLDWPSRQGLTTDQQQAELIGLLNGLQTAGINAVVFQVRSEADALYDSPFEPWSVYLTGTQGRAPDPFYDPLAFAVAEAHKRGMELHAWINPFRAERQNGAYPNASSHVTNTNPEWILSFSNGIRILNPGLSDVRDYVASVAADITRRYDVDGIHYDDYFYPYPGTGFSGISTEDDVTFAAEPRGFTDRGEWRRDNVNRLVAQIEDSIRAIKPDVVHGVSPFGIWKNGTPRGTTGLNAFGTIYADAVAWLDAQDVDYLAPQLYWSSQRIVNGRINQQRFTLLAPWWESVRNERHVYPGLAPYRVGGAGYAKDEVPTQIRYTRTREGIDGTILFRANAGVLRADQGLSDTLRTDLYRYPALPPPMPWRSQAVPGTPQALTATPSPDGAPGAVDLEWAAPAGGDAPARFYAVYRVEDGADIEDALEDPENLVTVTGGTAATDVLEDGRSYAYVVTAVSANSIESAPSDAAVLPGSVSAEPDAVLAVALEAPRPNPAAGPVTIPFVLEAASSVSLRVVDVLGREVAVLEDGPRTAGSHRAVWQPAAAGTYLVVLEADGVRATRTVSVVR